MEAHISEHRDETEENSKTHPIRGKELRMLQVAHHLADGRGKSVRAGELRLAGKKQRHECRAQGREHREHEESPAPSDKIAEHAWNETPAKTAQAGARHVNPRSMR